MTSRRRFGHETIQTHAVISALDSDADTQDKALFLGAHRNANGLQSFCQTKAEFIVNHRPDYWEHGYDENVVNWDEVLEYYFNSIDQFL